MEEKETLVKWYQDDIVREKGHTNLKAHYV
jgi:hypothetical protein